MKLCIYTLFFLNRVFTFAHDKINLRSVKIYGANQSLCMIDESNYEISKLAESAIWIISNISDNEYFYKRHNAEWRFIEKYPEHLVSLLKSVELTNKLLDEICGEVSEDGNAGNAVKHIIWSAILTNTIPYKQASEYLLAHESPNEGKLALVSVLDLYHNELGKELVRNYRRDTPLIGRNSYTFYAYLKKSVRELLSSGEIIKHRDGENRCDNQEGHKFRSADESLEFALKRISDGALDFLTLEL